MPDVGWSPLRRAGAIAAFAFVAGSLGDLGLTMVPGWGPESLAATPAEWLTQAADHPLLSARNLDLLNAVLAVVSLPVYAAVAASCRRTRPGIALLGLVLALLSAALFVSVNAALPMLDLGRAWAGADASDRVALEGAALALLARGAHGGLGALPAFLLSEVGTLVACLGMRGGPFGRVVPWLGVAGIAALAVYTLVVTFVPGAAGAMVALAAPGGLLMIAWYALVGRRLWGLARDG